MQCEAYLQNYWPLDSSKVYCLVTEAHVCSMTGGCHTYLVITVMF